MKKTKFMLFSDHPRFRDLEGSDPSPQPERVAALTECAQRFAGQEWTDKVFPWSSSVMDLAEFFLTGSNSLVRCDASLS